MENEEKEDLLLEVTESEDEECDKEEIDYYIEQKILDFIQNEKQNSKSSKKTIIFITTCLFLFLSSLVLIITVPIYIKYTSVTGISTYSKLVTLSVVNAIFFVVAHVIGVLLKCGSHTSPNHNLSFADVLKDSFLLSIGSILILWLIDVNYVSCHLKDPLKGFSIAFALLFYFIFSTKKMSLERTFCAITIIVGVFVSVDFGICDKFRCNGNSNLSETTPKLHFLYVILYLLAHGVWVLHFNFVEVCWSTFKGCNSNLNVSVLSNVSSNANSGTENLKPSIQSLSIICQEDEDHHQPCMQQVLKKENLPRLKGNRKSFFSSKSLNSKISTGRELGHQFSNSLPCMNQLSVPDFKRFPITSTPNNEMDGLQSWTSGRCYDVVLWQHITCCLIVLSLCWLPTMPFSHEGKGKLLVEVILEVFDSFRCHLNLGENSKCSFLPTFTILLSTSYMVLMLSSIELLKTTQSAVTVVSVMMPALPMSSLFWSLFRIGGSSTSIVEFNPEITGEAVCAVLGLPIIGIGIVLLIKSHIREFKMLP